MLITWGIALNVYSDNSEYDNSLSPNSFPAEIAKFIFKGKKENRD